MCCCTFHPSSVAPQPNSFLSHSHPLSSRALLPGFLQGLIYSIIPKRMKRDAKISSQRRGILLIAGWQPLHSSSGRSTQHPEEVPGSIQWADPQLSASTAPVTSSVLPQLLSDTDPAHCLGQQIPWSSDKMHFESPISDKHWKVELLWIHSSK